MSRSKISKADDYGRESHPYREADQRLNIKYDLNQPGYGPGYGVEYGYGDGISYEFGRHEPAVSPRPYSSYNQHEPDDKHDQDRYSTKVSIYDSMPRHDQIYTKPPPALKYPKLYNKPTTSEPQKEHNVLEHFGIFPNIPTTVILKIFSIILLILLVEINTYVNLDTLHPALEEGLGSGVSPFIGISLIGLFLGILFRYMDFELYRLRIRDTKQQGVKFKSYLTLIFLIAISLFVVLEVIVEIINTRGFLTGAAGGAFFIIDLLNILLVTIGTYTIFSTTRRMLIVSIIILFITMFLGIDYGTNIPLMFVLATLTLFYIEVTDGAIRLNKYINKFYELIDDHDLLGKLRYQIDTHMENMSKQFIKNLSIFMLLTLIISGMLLLLFVSYPYLTPSFIHENLELQTVYALMPIIVLLFMIFLFYYLISRYLSPSTHKQPEKMEFD